MHFFRCLLASCPAQQIFSSCCLFVFNFCFILPFFNFRFEFLKLASYNYIISMYVAKNIQCDDKFLEENSSLVFFNFVSFFSFFFHRFIIREWCVQWKHKCIVIFTVMYFLYGIDLHQAAAAAVPTLYRNNITFKDVNAVERLYFFWICLQLIYALHHFFFLLSVPSLFFGSLHHLETPKFNDIEQ